MSRFRPQVGPSISLFPFLAVLLCTMGSLLVLLVLFSSSANRAEADAAATAAAEAAKAAQQELELARDEMAWRIEQMAGMRARTMDDLARARMQLAGIEADSRQLVDELDELERTAAALEASPEASEEPISDLEQRLAAASVKLDEAKKNAADRPPAYAVVPYDGDAGTRRRPLYIECCVDGVFLQPEGIRLGPSDFEGPPGPGNPLASALRAAREYIASRPGESGDPNAQPYPLLLVRPSGVMAYYAARESLQSWGSEFGYQFIDEDWTLTYPPADPAMAAAENRAIEEARRRLEWLAQVRPPKRTKPAVQYRASTTRGGVVAAGGPSVLGDQSRWDWTEENGGSPGGTGRGFRAGGDGQGQGDAVLGNGAGDAAGGDSRWAAAGNAAAGGNYMGPSKFYGGAGDGQSPDGTGTSRGAEGGQGNAPHGGPDAGGGVNGSNASGGQVGSSAADGSAGQFATGQAGQAGGGTGGSSMQQAGQQGATGGGGGGQSMPGMPQSASASLGGPAAMGENSGAGSLAGRRGSNWASLASHDRPIPLTRPIRLECARDEFRVLGEGGRVMARVPIHGATADAVDPLVREVHATVGSWGIAGDRMYWRPELVLSSTPDGTARLTDLEHLLTDSGLDTRRATLPRETVRPLPPVYRTGTGGQPASY
jgi:hypothetical protein